MSTEASNSISLWTTLHDGILEALRSDLSVRALSFVIDSSFHRDFHHLPSGTRIQVLGVGVRSIVAFDFEPWPDATEPPQSTPWEEAQEQRRRDAAKGRLTSTDWHDFASQIGTDQEYIIMTAELDTEGPWSVLRLGVNSYPASDFREIEVRAEKFRFLVGERDLDVPEFEKFGDAYWDDWSQHTARNADETETSEAQG